MALAELVFARAFFEETAEVWNSFLFGYNTFIIVLFRVLSAERIHVQTAQKKLLITQGNSVWTPYDTE